MGLKLKINPRIVLTVALRLGSGLVLLAGLVVVIAWMAGVFGEKIEARYVERPRPKASEEERNNAYRVREVYKYYIEEAVGTLKAAERTEISARVLAPIEEISVRAGDEVTKDKILVRLDPRTLKAELSQAEASLVAARAAELRTQNSYRRTLEVYREQATSKASLDRATEGLQVAQANRKHAEQVLAAAEVRLSYTTITAPKAGVVVDRLVESGDMARPGEPLLVLYDKTSLRLEVPVMENLAVNLKLGDELNVRIDARDREIKARVDEIVPQAEAASRSFLVKVSLPRSDDLFEGLFGRLRIPVGKRRHLCLHTDTIETIGQLQFVDVIAADGTKQRRLIKTGRFGDENHLEVLSGLEKGEAVVMKRQ